MQRRPAVREPAPREGRRRAPVREGVRTRVTPGPSGWPEAVLRAGALYSQLGLEPTPTQRAALEALGEPGDLLLSAPTGSGKTLALWTPVLAWLAQTGAAPVGALYLAPLRALVAQQRRVLEGLSARWDLGLRVGARTGDTDAEERKALRREPPHVLVLTPESLAIVLAQPARVALAQVRVVVLDEVHQLALGKRGALLSATLATLDAWVERCGHEAPRRLGASATVRPLERAARWLSGPSRPARAVEVLQEQRREFSLLGPSLREPFPGPERLSTGVLPAVARSIASCDEATLLFVPSRPRAEHWTQALREVLPARMPVGCHHGSLSAQERALVASQLEAGSLRAVVATSSLELGVDVRAGQSVLLGAPSSVARLLQLAGRAQHHPGGVPVARLVASHAVELARIVAALRCAARGDLEATEPRQADLDVLVQSVLGLCALGPQDTVSLRAALRRTDAFEAVTEDTVDRVLALLATGGEAMEAYPEVQRIRFRGDGWVLSDERSARRYARGVGTLQDEPAVTVRTGARAVGTLEGRFAALLEVGDRLALAGRAWRVLSRETSELRVEPAPEGGGVVAQWTGSRAPMSALLGAELEALLGEWDSCAEEATLRAQLAPLGVEPADAATLWALVRAQSSRAAVPCARRSVVELVARGSTLLLLLHTTAGSAANEVLSLVAALRLRAALGVGVDVLPSELCAGLAVRRSRAAQDSLSREGFVRSLFAPAGLRGELESALEGSALAKMHFREVARVAQFGLGASVHGAVASPSLLYDVLRKYAPSHLLLEALREGVWSSLEGERALRAAEALAARPLALCAPAAPSPLALAALAHWGGGRDGLPPEDLEDALARAAHRLALEYGGALP